MDEQRFVIDVLTQWVITRQDFETLLANELAGAHLDPQERERLAKWAREDFARLQEGNLDYFTRLRGNPDRLASEIGGFLRW